VDISSAARDAVLGPLVERTLGSLVDSARDKLVALHYAFLNVGALVYVKRGTIVEQPLTVTYEGAGLTTPHTLVVLEEGAALDLVERHSGEPALVSGASEIVLGRNAQLRFVQAQEWTSAAWAFQEHEAKLDADAHLRTLTLALGGRYTRDSIRVVLEGKSSQADLLGLVAGTGRQHVDFQTLQDHVADHTRSDLFIHNGLEDRSSSNFTGLIRIGHQAHATESSQEQRNILLSPKAHADSDPKLEILNNDVVRCTHGASVAPMDPDAIFFLQSRGLDAEAARDLVLGGFFRDVVARLGSPALEEAVYAAVDQKLHAEAKA
jgi:Fe-S cluster assembly protein SufD